MEKVNSKVYGEYTITLKNVKEVIGHDDCLPFTATLYINNKRIGACYNDGWGGIATINVDDNHTLFEKASNEVKTHKEMFRNMEFSLTIQEVVDCIACAVIDAMKAKKYIKKAEKNSLVFSKNDDYYGLQIMSIPINVNGKKGLIADVLKKSNGVEFIKNTIKKYVGKGYEVANTNLPQEMLKLC